MAMTGICVFTSSPRLTRRFSTKPSNGARMLVSRTCRSASFAVACDAWMLAPRFRAFCSAES